MSESSNAPFISLCNLSKWATQIISLTPTLAKNECRHIKDQWVTHKEKLIQKTWQTANADASPLTMQSLDSINHAHKIPFKGKRKRF